MTKETFLGSPVKGTGTVATGSCSQRETGLKAISYGQVGTDSSVGHCDSIPDRKQLKGRRIYCGHSLGGYGPSWCVRRGRVAGGGSLQLGLPILANQEAEKVLAHNWNSIHTFKNVFKKSL